MSTATLTSATSSVETGERMPTSGLLALGLLGFIAILTETLPAGLLPQIGSGVSVGDAQAGQLVTAYAIGSVAAAIPGAVLTRGWQRRAGADADIAQSLIVTIWNSAIASGGVGGGLLLETLGPAAFAPSVGILAVLALMIARRASVHGFPRGRRA